MRRSNESADLAVKSGRAAAIEAQALLALLKESEVTTSSLVCKPKCTVGIAPQPTDNPVGAQVLAEV
jgi:hypothetical protein